MAKKTIKQYIRDAAVGFMFGLKKADDEMFKAQLPDNSSDFHQEQQQETKSVVQALLRGEITQQVEELRYSMYAVGKKMRDYTLDKNGVIHHSEYVEKTGTVIKQENLQDTVDSEESLAMGFKFKDVRHIKIKYKNNPPRFNLDNFLTFVEFNTETKICTLYFATLYNPFVGSATAFMNAMKKIGTYTDDKQFLVDPIISNIVEIEFVTMKAQGREDFFRFLLKNLKTDVNTIQYSNTGMTTKISFQVGDYEETDERAKFECQSMQEKYDKKEARENTYNPFAPDPADDKEVIFHCEECGKEIDVTEYRMNEYDFGIGLCDECACKRRGIEAPKDEEDKDENTDTSDTNRN